MFYRCRLLFVVSSLAVSGGALWASPVFVDISATNGYTKAWPTGVAPGGAVLMQGVSTSLPNSYYNPYYYAGGTTATMTNMYPFFPSSSGAITRIKASAMNDSGQVTISQWEPVPAQGWLYLGGAAATAVTYPGSSDTFSIAINDKGDLGGAYWTSTPGPANAFVDVGAGQYGLNPPSSTAGSPNVTALADPVTAGGVTTGQAAGMQLTSGGTDPTGNHAVVWSYTINSNGTMTSQTALDLQTSLPAGHNLGDAMDFSGSLSSQALAINDSGQVVVGARTNAVLGGPQLDTNYLLYNMSTQAFTPLSQGSENLMLYDPLPATSSFLSGGHAQAINNAGQVVGYTGTQSDGSWQAAVWQNGVITDLNTTYASLLAGTGFTLNCATAIDNNGDIAGWGTDAQSNTYQAFVIMNMSAPLPGDANDDGKVDINDLTIVLSHYGQTGMTWSEGEFTGDGTVDINDLTIVLAHYGDTAGSLAGGMAAVPEPSSVLLLAAGLLGLLACVARKRT